MDFMDYYITDYKTTNVNATALEDSIMHKGHPVTAGSKILENFISPFSATVITRLPDNGIAIAGKTKMDEFGIDMLFNNTVSGKEPPAGGLDRASGAVRAVADKAVLYTLCNDVFGRYRREAPEHGLCYIHPTYGTVSRFGLIPLVSSMDQIGIVCRNADDGFGLLSLIAGNDPNDGAMFKEKKYRYEKYDKKLCAAVPDICDIPAIHDFAARFNKVRVHLEHFEVYKQLMYILCAAEISANISRYDGIKFGYRAEGYKNLEELYTKTRTEGFGLQTKLAAIAGSMVLSQDHYAPYYQKAMKIRRLIKESLVFDTYDVIVLPLTISKDPYENLSLYALAPLAGLPSITFSHNGTGIQLVADVKNENALYTAWEAVQ